MATRSKPTNNLPPFILLFLLSICLTGCAPSGNTTNTNGGTLATASPTPSPSPTPVDCTAAKPEEIVKAIYRELAPLKLGEGAFDFNISVETPPTINIVGWSPQKTAILAAIAKAAPNCTVSSTPVTFFDQESQLPPEYRRTGCTGGFKPCGDVCLPPDQHCAWAGSVEVRSGDGKTSTTTAVNSNSNTTSNSTANSNSAANATSNTNSNTAKKP